MKEYSSHPFSEIFPLMPPSDIKELADDIKQRGLQNPITLYDGKILDGRHRLEACQQSGVKPRFDEYKGNDPLGFVIAANLKRRHLTTSQKAMVAAAIANLPRGGDRKSEAANQSANLRFDHERAAESLNVSARSVDTASKIINESPRLAKQVRDDKISLNAAAVKLAEAAAEQKPAFDEVGFPIPKECLQYFRRSGEIQELLTAVSRIKTKLETKRAEDDVLFRNISQAVVNELALAYSFIANAKPYAVCLNCQGKLKDSCRGCKGTGLMAKFAYEHEQVKGLRTMRESLMAKGNK